MLNRCEQMGPEIVYVSGRTRAEGEMNGKSANLNNCLSHLYPDSCRVPANEIVCIFDADQVRCVTHPFNWSVQETECKKQFSCSGNGSVSRHYMWCAMQECRKRVYELASIYCLAFLLSAKRMPTHGLLRL